jgi:hypothetical protein
VVLLKVDLGLAGTAHMKLAEVGRTRSVVLPYFDTELGYDTDLRKTGPEAGRPCSGAFLGSLTTDS